MKKNFFVKEYPLAMSADNVLNTRTTAISTFEIDFEQLEQQLPAGAKIKSETVQTTIEADRFIIFGEYTLTDPLPSAPVAATESVELKDVLGEDTLLPSVN
jgi:hypothetical protein